MHKPMLLSCRRIPIYLAFLLQNSETRLKWLVTWLVTVTPEFRLQEYIATIKLGHGKMTTEQVQINNIQPKLPLEDSG